MIALEQYTYERMPIEKLLRTAYEELGAGYSTILCDGKENRYTVNLDGALPFVGDTTQTKIYLSGLLAKNTKLTDIILG